MYGARNTVCDTLAHGRMDHVLLRLVDSWKELQLPVRSIQLDVKQKRPAVRHESRHSVLSRRCFVVAGLQQIAGLGVQDWWYKGSGDPAEDSHDHMCVKELMPKPDLFPEGLPPLPEQISYHLCERAASTFIVFPCHDCLSAECRALTFLALRLPCRRAVFLRGQRVPRQLRLHELDREERPGSRPDPGAPRAALLWQKGALALV